MTDTQTRVSREQIRARYEAGTMSYESCLAYLEREHRMSEDQADNWLMDRKQ